MSPIILDWNAIRPLNGSRASGFEELCSQLARAEKPDGSRFERKGTPDAGVECYAVLQDGSEWGWQAKYFDSLGDSQWAQLDASVKTALEKHPALVHYFICVPLNRPDARIDGRLSAMDRWTDHVQKWTSWASAKGRTVQFIYWGSHELLERLVRLQHVGRMRFWFDIHGFDGAWFAARLEEALRTAGPRYTPEIHVDLPIAAELEAFGRTKQLFDRIQAHALAIRKKLPISWLSDPKPEKPVLHLQASTLWSEVQEILGQLSSLTVQPIGPLPFQEIAKHVASAESAIEDLERSLLDEEREYKIGALAKGKEDSTWPRSMNAFRERRYSLSALSSELRETHDALTHAREIAERYLMILNGAAGTGKTHLLCDIARQRVSAGQPTVLLMGQRFVTANDPWSQALDQLDLRDFSAEEFVGALESAAQAAGCRALVLIDAINEGSGRLIWPNHLAAFLAHTERSPWIGTLLSIRSPYEELIIPTEIRRSAVNVTHHGFADHEYDATRTFFVYYGLELPTTPLLAPEFRNPLFLKTLCLGLNAKGERRLPRGSEGITSIFGLYLDAVNDRLARTLDFNPKAGVVRQALLAFAETVAGTRERWLTIGAATKTVDSLLPGRDFERSLYRGLVAEGVLTETILFREMAHQEVVFIAYERFADHLVAKVLLDTRLDQNTPASAFEAGQPLSFLWDKRKANMSIPACSRPCVFKFLSVQAKS